MRARRIAWMNTTSIEKLTSLGLTTLIHVAAGFAVMMALPLGARERGAADQGRRGVFVVEMIPLDSTVVPKTGGKTGKDVGLASRPVEPAAVQPERRSRASLAIARQVPASLGASAEHPHARSAPANSADLSAVAYRDVLLAHIAQFQRYPAEARRARMEGAVEVRFILNRNGDILQAWIIASSGIEMLDQEALAAVRRAAPMPQVPLDLPETVDITLPIDFEMK